MLSYKFRKTCLVVAMAMLFASGVLHAEPKRCGNIGASVILHSAYVEDMIQALALVESMPLFPGEIALSDHWSAGPWARVEICTQKEYAELGHITSFEVARQVLSIVEGRGNPWMVQSVRATYVMEGAEFLGGARTMSNVGTVGH